MGAVGLLWAETPFFLAGDVRPVLRAVQSPELFCFVVSAVLLFSISLICHITLCKGQPCAGAEAHCPLSIYRPWWGHWLRAGWAGLDPDLPR